MKSFDYAAPTSLDEASKLLAQDGSAVLAGGRGPAQSAVPG